MKHEPIGIEKAQELIDRMALVWNLEQREEDDEDVYVFVNGTTDLTEQSLKRFMKCWKQIACSEGEEFTIFHTPAVRFIPGQGYQYHFSYKKKDEPDAQKRVRTILGTIQSKALKTVLNTATLFFCNIFSFEDMREVAIGHIMFYEMFPDYMKRPENDPAYDDWFKGKKPMIVHEIKSFFYENGVPKKRLRSEKYTKMAEWIVLIIERYQRLEEKEKAS